MNDALPSDLPMMHPGAPDQGRVAFQTRLGYEVRPGQADIGGVALQRDYDGPGLDRVPFAPALASDLAP